MQHDGLIYTYREIITMIGSDNIHFLIIDPIKRKERQGKTSKKGGNVPLMLGSHNLHSCAWNTYNLYS